MRSVRFAVVTIVPIGLVVAWLYALMYLAGFALNWVTATIAAVSIGIGIDYSIHMTQRVPRGAGKSCGQGPGAASSGAGDRRSTHGLGGYQHRRIHRHGLRTHAFVRLLRHTHHLNDIPAATASLVVLPSLLLLVAPASE